MSSSPGKAVDIVVEGERVRMRGMRGMRGSMREGSIKNESAPYLTAIQHRYEVL